MIDRKPFTLVLAYSIDGKPEVTKQLYPHTGPVGFAADLKLYEYADKLSSLEMTEMELVFHLMKDPEFIPTASLTLDLLPEELEAVSFPELVGAFMTGMRYRTGAFNQPEVNEALKKSEGEPAMD
jgi:hypothetical protein